MSVPLQTLHNSAPGAQSGGNNGAQTAGNSNTGFVQSSQPPVNTTIGSQSQSTTNSTASASNVTTTPSGKKSLLRWWSHPNTCVRIGGYVAIFGLLLTIVAFGRTEYFSQRQDVYGATQIDLTKKADRIQTWKDCNDKSLVSVRAEQDPSAKANNVKGIMKNSTICAPYRGLSYDDAVKGGIPSISKRALFYNATSTAVASMDSWLSERAFLYKYGARHWIGLTLQECWSQLGIQRQYLATSLIAVIIIRAVKQSINQPGPSRLIELTA
ncbi:hypothetical protein BU16DRAFT_604320 [Lophium mytilinum]|uniref:Uncharacterized protein n=1 Tax=Lophium mytilinum TaxID=390894 RepID=A0A6A6R2W5_9PEZI|nr:hypothetical protein BU16DRAFT_604320 [Lophium mytilinum]